MPAPVHAEMAAAAGGKNVWIVGGGDLAGQFADAGLLDEVIVYIAPVTLGSGAPLLPRCVELRLEELGRNRDLPHVHGTRWCAPSGAADRGEARRVVDGRASSAAHRGRRRAAGSPSPPDGADRGQRRLRRLLVELPRRGRRPASFRERADVDRPTQLISPDLEPVADRDLARGLGAHAVHLDVAAGDGFGRGIVGLEEARRPEPFVDPHTFHG